MNHFGSGTAAATASSSPLSSDGCEIALVGLATHEAVVQLRRDRQRVAVRTAMPIVALSPGDEYVVAVPVPMFAATQHSRPSVVRVDVGHGKPKVVASGADVAGATDAPAATRTSDFQVAFCGEGRLFAVSLTRKIVIYRGADGTALASVAADTGGALSFNRSGKHLIQTLALSREAVTTIVYRLE